MKDESDLKAIMNSLRKHNDELLAGMRELEQENMDKEDENAALLQRLLVAREETYVAIDAERLRAWKENKAFQYDLAEQNAVLRKQLGEKHDDNCRLQRQLAEENRKLLDALEVREDLEASTLSATVRMSNAEVMNDDLHAQLERLTSKVETLWERNLHIRLFRCMR